MLPGLKTKVEDAVVALEEQQGAAEEAGVATDEFKESNAEWGLAQTAITDANAYIESGCAI